MIINPFMSLAIKLIIYLVIKLTKTVFHSANPLSPIKARSRRLPKILQWPYRGQCLVVLYVDHYLQLHCQPGRLSDRRTDGDADQFGRRSGQADRGRVRCAEGQQYAGVLPSELLFMVVDHNLWFKIFEASNLLWSSSKHVRFEGGRRFFSPSKIFDLRLFSKTPSSHNPSYAVLLTSLI